MGWDRYNPASAFYTYNPGNANDMLNGLKDRNPISYKSMTARDDKIVDIVVIGCDWGNANPIIMSVDPNTMMSVIGDKITSNKTKANSDLNWRPDKFLDYDDPTDGFDLNQDNISKLNSRLDKS